MKGMRLVKAAGAPSFQSRRPAPTPLIVAFAALAVSVGLARADSPAAKGAEWGVVVGIGGHAASGAPAIETGGAPAAPINLAQLQSGAQGGAASTGPKVWTTDSLAKVQPDAQPGSLKTVKMSAARNEFQSFQVHVRSGASPIQLNLTVSDFSGPGGSVIHSSSNVIVYREAYLDIAKLSDANGALGVTPDPLIPTIDPYFHEARNAFPVTVPANQTQSAWIDVLAPLNARPGLLCRFGDD